MSENDNKLMGKLEQQMSEMEVEEKEMDKKLQEIDALITSL